MHYLNSYTANFEAISDLIDLIPNHCLVGTDNEDKATISEKCRILLGIRNIEVCLVHHCPNAYGVAITLEDGWKMVYSGDTMPCQELIKIGN